MRGVIKRHIILAADMNDIIVWGTTITEHDLNLNARFQVVSKNVSISAEPSGAPKPHFDDSGFEPRSSTIWGHPCCSGA